MSYRIFAIATLITAPVIAMVAQNFVPQTGDQQAAQPPFVEPSAGAQPSAGAPDVAPPPAAPTPPFDMAPTDDMAAFGQPMAGAGQPALAPGQGLPDPSLPVPAASGTSPTVGMQRLPPAPGDNL